MSTKHLSLVPKPEKTTRVVYTPCESSKIFARVVTINNASYIVQYRTNGRGKWISVSEHAFNEAGLESAKKQADFLFFDC